MNTRLPGPDVLEEADGWFARLTSPACSDAERAVFEEWRATPQNAAAFAESERLWRDFGKISHRADMRELSDRIFAESRPRRFTTNKFTLALAASLAVGIIGSILYFGLQYYAANRTYTTEVGERSIFRLDDGSQLMLNAATRLQVKMTRTHRHFTLHKGEALFSVARDPSRPFTVSAGDSEVIALGTRFTVRMESQRTIVTLLEGKVAIERQGNPQKVQLAPGEQVRITPNAPQIARSTVDPDLAASWTVGRLKFRDTPLIEVINDVNRYSKTTIRLGDPSLAATPVSGTFEIGDSESMVAALQELLPLSIDLQRRGEIVLVRK